jgi:hypothetical protein
VLETITLKEALSQMDTGKKFSISFITFDKRKDEGGELIEVASAHKHNWVSPEEFKKQQQIQPASRMAKKNPRHYQNSTRNIILPGSEVRKVHIRLIRKFNGMVVL